MKKNKNLFHEKLSRFPRQDSRNDLGYGRTQAKFSIDRKSGAAFPYNMTDEDLANEEEIDAVDFEGDEIPFKAMKKAVPGVRMNDFMASKAVNPFYFAGGGRGLFEVTVDVMSRLLGQYGHSQNPVGYGSSFDGFRSSIRPTGSKVGWSQAPRKIDDTKKPKRRLHDFSGAGEDDENVKKFIRAAIAKENEENEDI